MVTAPFPWLARPWQQFLSVVEQHRLPHALLLYGPTGVGKGALASEMARYLVAQDAKNAALLDSAAGHPDVLWVQPEGKLEVIKIETVRAVQDFLTQTPLQGKYRVVIIRAADRFNAASGNALLKVLEEPGDHTLIVLLASGVQALLPTLKSRCQRWPIRAVQTDAMPWLIQQGVPETFVREYWQYGGGAPLALKSFYEGELHGVQKAFFEALLSESVDPLRLAETVQTVPVMTLVNWLLSLLYALIRVAFHEPGGLLGWPDAHLVRVVKRTRIAAWFAQVDRCYAAKAILQQPLNPNEMLLLEDLLIAWPEIRMVNTF